MGLSLELKVWAADHLSDQDAKNKINLREGPAEQ